MDLMTRTLFHRLLEASSSPSVSLYLPTHRAAPEAAQDPIRFKNLLHDAERRLRDQEFSESTIRSLLKPAERWLDDDFFWQHQSDGLAVFLTESSRNRFCLPRRFIEQVHVGNRFHVTPLLPLLQSNGRWYLLAVSQNLCRLFRGTRDTVEELPDVNLPRDLKSALGWWRERELNLHSMQSRPQTRGGDATAVFHGHFEDSTKDDLRAWFRRIDEAICSTLRNDNAPLVFAGVDYLFPLYREVNNYRGLCDTPVTGNPDHLSAEQLHDAGWNVVQPIFTERTERVLTKLPQLRRNHTATDDVAKILQAADSGLVDTLVIPQRTRYWGRYDPNGPEVHLQDGPGPDAEDLLERATLMTVQTSGDVVAVEPERLPAGVRAVARLRAPVEAVSM